MVHPTRETQANMCYLCQVFVKLIPCNLNTFSFVEFVAHHTIGAMRDRIFCRYRGRNVQYVMCVRECSCLTTPPSIVFCGCCWIRKQMNFKGLVRVPSWSGFRVFPLVFVGSPLVLIHYLLIKNSCSSFILCFDVFTCTIPLYIHSD